jgi:signal transduction histidine kinase
MFLSAIVCHSFLSFSQKTIAGLRVDLNRGKTASVKADVAFELSRRFADALKIDSALYYAEKVKEYSEQDKYRIGLGKYHVALALAFYFRGKNDESKKNVLEAIRILTSQHDNSMLGVAFWQLGICEDAEKKINYSRKNYQQSVNLLRNAGDNVNLYRSYFWMGRSFSKTSEYDSAAGYYLKALELAELSKDSFKIYISSCELGKSFLKMREFNKALQYLGYGLQNRSSAAGKVSTWLFLSDYATCLSLAHEFRKADAAIKEFEVLTVKFNHEWGHITLDKLKGIQYNEMQNYAEALKYLGSAYQKSSPEVINNNEINFIAFNLGSVEFKLKKFDSAIIHLKRAGELSRSVKDDVGAMEADLLVSQAYERITQPDSALHYYQLHTALKQSVLSLEKQKIIAELTTKYETEKKDQAIKMLQKEGEASSYSLLLQKQEIEKQQLENEKKTQALAIISQQNEINKLDANQKTFNLENQQRENEKNQVRLSLLEKEAAYQKLLAAKQNQQKKMLYTGITILLVAGAFVFHRYTRRKKIQNQQDMLNERLRISRELHDELGATLSGVALFSEIAKQKMAQHNEEEVQLYLGHISAGSLEMVEKMGDLVWTINPGNESLEHMLDRLKDYAINLCSGKNISLHFDIDEASSHLFPTVQERRNIYLLSKEGINNAIKYAAASNIFYSIKKSGSNIVLEIRDDGKGFDKGFVTKGNGLDNMQARAAELNTHLDIQTNPGKGTCIQLCFSFHPIGGQKR